MVFGYVFWFVLSRITTSEIIGESSTIVAIATIFITVASIGVPTGVQRFLGKSFVENKIGESIVYVRASMLLTVIGVTISSVVILVMSGWFEHTFGIDFKLLIITITLIISSSIYTLSRSIIISSLNTEKLPIITILSSIVKIILAIVLVMIGTGSLGIAIGFSFFPISAAIFLTIILIMRFRHAKKEQITRLSPSLKKIFAASVATWIPSVIYTMGVHLGTIVVFGVHGASQAGVYFIAFSIVTGISAIMSVLFTISYPTLSGMKDGRKRLTWRITKLSLLISIPFSYSIIFYSKDIMQLFGQNYNLGSTTLMILLVSMLPTILATGINTLSYSYGNYRQVLAIGLASNIPRTVLYFILVPIYGGPGAAIAYTIGSIIGLAISIIIAKKIAIHIFWKEIGLILLIPTVLSYVTSHLQINPLISIPAIIIISYLLLLKIGTITRTDMEDSLGVLPHRISIPMLTTINKIARKLNHSY